MVINLLKAHHDEMAHPGIKKTLQGIKQNFWFPLMRKRIYDYIKNCFTCLMANNSANRFKNETQLFPLPKTPMEILHMDHFGPLEESEDNYKFLLIIIDSFSPFIWFFPVKSTGSKEVINHLENLLNTFEKSKEIVTDREYSIYINQF